jgi:hypothetical protein
MEAGVAKQVLALLNNNVSNTEAKGAVMELKEAIDTLSKPVVPA